MAKNPSAQYCTIIGLPGGAMFELGPFADRETARNAVHELINGSNTNTVVLRITENPRTKETGIDGPTVVAYETWNWPGPDRTPEITNRDTTESWSMPDTVQKTKEGSKAPTKEPSGLTVRTQTTNSTNKTPSIELGP